MADKVPFLSVLMTAYNRDKYIAEAIESVLSSSYKNFELIILDDCSTDKTFATASFYLSKDKRIKLYRNDYNLGQFANRNKAIILAKGIYVKFVDSDDKIMPNGLELMVKAMEAYPDAGIGVPAKHSYEDNLPTVMNPHESVLQHYLGNNHLCHGPTGVIFKKEILMKAGLFEELYGILADTLLNIKIASISPTVLFEKNLFFWRMHDDQVTVEQKDNVRMIRERFIILKAVMCYKFLPLNKNETDLILSNFIKINTMHFIRYAYRGRFKDAFQIKKDTGLSAIKLVSAIFKNSKSNFF